jgi:hypothetical protein
MILDSDNLSTGFPPEKILGVRSSLPECFFRDICDPHLKCFLHLKMLPNIFYTKKRTLNFF